jgi:class 3 adenylate cyclase
VGRPPGAGPQDPRDLAIVFTDLVGFSSWALEAGDEAALELLREVGVVVEGCVEEHGGRIIKRLGDGVMAVFDAPDEALAAMSEAIAGVDGLQVDGYRPGLRAGLHVGQARRLGGDYLGVEVNIAARICEDARVGEAFVSDAALERLDGASIELRGGRTVRRPGMPEDLGVHVAVLGGT